MARWGRGLFGLVNDMMRASEERERQEKQREALFAATVSRQMGYNDPGPQAGYPGQEMPGGAYGYPNQGMPGGAMGYPGQGMPGGAMGYPGQGMPGGTMGYPGQGMPGGTMGYPAQGMDLAEAIRESMNFAAEIAGRHISEDGVRLEERLRVEFLVFLEYLYDPDSADPIQQVSFANQLLRMRMTTQQFFQHRNQFGLDPKITGKVPEALVAFVLDDLTGAARPINSAMSMSIFLVNTFRDLGLVYISFGGVSELKLRRLTNYICMLAVYLKQHRLLHTMDPYRRGGSGNPNFGLPPMDIEAEEEPDILARGIDMPSSKKAEGKTEDGLEANNEEKAENCEDITENSEEKAEDPE